MTYKGIPTTPTTPTKSYHSYHWLVVVFPFEILPVQGIPTTTPVPRTGSW